MNARPDPSVLVAKGSEVIRVREHPPPVFSGEQVVARPGVSAHLSLVIERIPMHADEDGVLAELANVGFEPLPCSSAGRTAICVNRRSEVNPHVTALRHV